MGKDLKGKELGVGISQESTGLYSARFVDRFGKRKHKRFKKLQECRDWLADAIYVDEHSDISMPSDMLVDHWFDYWIGIKKKTVRPNTVRNYTERYIRNIKPLIGKMLLSDVKPLHCQKIFYDMACQTAHCGRGKSHFIFGGLASPIVPYRNLTQTTDGITADCRSLV